MLHTATRGQQRLLRLTNFRKVRCLINLFFGTLLNIDSILAPVEHRLRLFVVDILIRIAFRKGHPDPMLVIDGPVKRLCIGSCAAESRRVYRPS